MKNSLFLTSGLVIFFLILIAIFFRTQAQRLRRQSGLPPGEIVYEDVSGLARQSFYSQRFGLTGKPDYLLQDTQNNLIPVEVKSGFAPRQPYESHRLQLAAYFLLIEDTLQRSAPYGLIRYRNRTVEIANTDELRTVDECHDADANTPRTKHGTSQSQSSATLRSLFGRAGLS